VSEREPSAEARRLAANPNVALEGTGTEDLLAGRVDERIVAVLATLARDHTISIASLCSDHPKFTAGGVISSHHHGRGADIAGIDGVPISAWNSQAREIAVSLRELDPAIRPDEIGTPWAITGPGYFTDAGHQHHLHIGFRQPIVPGSDAPSGDHEPPPGDQSRFDGWIPFAELVAAPGAPDLTGGPRPQPGEAPVGGDAPAKLAEHAGLPAELPAIAGLLAAGTTDGAAVRRFIDGALAVKRQRIASGDVDFGRDPADWAGWVAELHG
jgi:hypothetical protein